MHADAMPEADRSTLADPARRRGADRRHRRGRRAPSRAARDSKRPRSRARRERDGARGLAARGRRARRGCCVVDPRARDACATLASRPRAAARARRLLVVNDAATLPASLAGRSARRAGRGAPGRRRRRDEAASGRRSSSAPATGASGPRTGRRRRALAAGDASSTLGGRARGRGRRGVRALSPRLVEVRFDREGAALWRALFRVGRPVQYSYLRDAAAALARADRVRGPAAGRRDAVGRAAASPAAAARALAPARRRDRDGHARRRPLVDGRPRARRRAAAAGAVRSCPRPTVAAVEASQGRGGRVVAVGTTVVRALEGALDEDGPRARRGEGDQPADRARASRPRVVDGSSPASTSRERATSSCCRPSRRGRCSRPRSRTPRDAGYLGHEFGDSSLVLAAA